jgi:photosynthetic reaction center cytochrome c subunit
MTTSLPSPPQSVYTRGLAAMLLALLTALAAGASPAEPPKPQSPAPAAKASAPASSVAPGSDGEPTAEKKFKNIKVLRSMPASQMIPVMHLFEASLGVSCNFCHVTENDQFELDTKKEKETAREMIRMVMDINKTNFEGRTVVTCNTCHGGREHPVPVPPIPQGQLAEAAPHAEPEAREKLPSASQILDRYIEALGGRTALLAVKSRVSRGTLLHAKVADPNAAKAAVINRGQEDPLEISAQWPGKVTVVLGPSNWRLVEQLDGTSGTVVTPNKETRPMTGGEVARFTALGDLRRDLDLQDRADKVRVGGKDKIDGRDVYILRAPTTEGGRELLYFDVQTGLLRRRLAFRPTVIGNDPEQTDLEDYRPTGGTPGGVKVPFVVKVSYLDDNHLGTTRKLTEVRDNVSQ